LLGPIVCSFDWVFGDNKLKIGSERNKIGSERNKIGSERNKIGNERNTVKEALFYKEVDRNSSIHPFKWQY